ncbi:enoyl-CoA hydratase family protein [Gordonia jinhuaensis]|uniref:Enoyl-CoA hydratase/isomerase n=1 Tax=Gordonia jinhuaensis TaxID=1517702 RepID=A0A916WZY1_9ACTN|nr:enoyl-CoA hydratase family protein [Gordonia jinhuaensis]GGB46824.1 putative enoyl-CoA hydratase/isomerase [Gordonia jinhuaensis]
MSESGSATAQSTDQVSHEPEVVRWSVERGIATIVLDSPANRNALSSRLVTQLFEAFAALADDSVARVVVLTHTGGTFCAGADLAEATAGAGAQMTLAEKSAMSSGWMVELMRTILDFPKPVIARIDGHARAGGLGLIAACDVAVAGPTCTFALTEVRLALAPSVISLVLVPKVSNRALNRYILTGEVFGPQVAAEIGLVTAATDSVEQLDEVVQTVATAMRKGSPQGLAASKSLVTSPILERFDRAPALVELGSGLFSSPEAKEGMTAFLQKRPPTWDSDR